jgi:dipeptidyl aminopeptidase/acylaminoacyl peptidase
VLYDAGGWVHHVAVSRDGRRAAIECAGAPAMSDQLLLADGPVSESQPRALTAADEHAVHAHTAWTPDGGALIVTTNRGREFTAIARLEVADGTWTWLVSDDAHDLAAFASPDGRLLLVATNDDGATRLALHDAATGDLLRTVALTADAWTAGFPLPDPAWSPDSRHVALTVSAPHIPGDVLLVDADSGQVRTLTDSTARLAGHEVSRPVPHRVPTPDGELVPCFVYPPTAETELNGSAVLVIHGGPESQATRIFSPFTQALAAAGHTVLVPNVRGSVGYGKRWYSLDDVRLRLNSVADLATLHEYLPSLGLDPARAALWGGSYGGYMVLAGVAFQPERWAVGVDIVGFSSLVTFLQNTSAYRRTLREREYGYLERDLEFLREASPLTHVDDIRAPLFVIHGANDPRVPLSEAEQLAAALKRNGVPVELLVYGDEGHGLAKRANRLDAYPKAVAFLADRLR